MELISNYTQVLQGIYDHVGFTPDWVVLPILDETNSYWQINEDEVLYADSIEELKDEEGNFYSAEIYKQRFYNKWVYKGELFTMIFINPQVDGMRYFALFDNSKEIV